jgi:hypothetical protein
MEVLAVFGNAHASCSPGYPGNEAIFRIPQYNEVAEARIVFTVTTFFSTGLA